MDIVVNEWFLEYMLPRSEHYSLSNRFLDAMEKRADRLVIRKPIVFTGKLYKYAEQTEHEKAFTRVFRIMLDLTKVRLVDSTQIPKLESALATKIPADDLYLVELAYHTSDRIIITTHRKLATILKAETDLKVFLLDDFLENYCS